MGTARTAAKLDQDDVVAALRELVEACEYVRPFAGCVAVTASVKDIRLAGRFVKAVENAKRILRD